MNRSIALAFVFILLIASCIALIQPVKASENSWVTMSPVPTPYYGFLGAAQAEGKIYFLGDGISARYDPETDNWTAILPLPIYNSWATVVACQNKIYVIGGWADHPTQVYDPATDTWENKTSLPSTRGAIRANVVEGKIYLIAGAIPAPPQVISTSSETDVYDPASDSWSTMAPIPTPVMGYASAVLDGKIYIIGGGTAASFRQNASTLVQIFDPKTNQWTNGTSIPIGVCYAEASLTTGLLAPKRVYVVGGLLNYGGPYLGTASLANQVYDPETQTWSVAASIPNNRWYFSLVNVDDALYAVGGTNSSVQSRNLIPEKEAIAATQVQANERYIPTGYKGILPPAPTLPSPSPSPTPNISPSPSPSPSPTPTLSPSPSIPEFPSWIILSVVAITTLLAVTLVRSKKTKNRFF